MTKRRTAALFKDQPQTFERQQRRLSRQQQKLQRDIENVTQMPVRNTKAQINLNTLKHLEPLTDTQADVFDAFADPDNMAFVLYGSAGTGKTFLAMYHALCEVLDPQSDFDKIIIVRTTAQVRDVGYLKGELNEKIAPFEAPYIAICQELFGVKDAYEKLKDLGKIQFESTAFLRGVSFNNAIVIADEIQNYNWAEINTLAGRVGQYSKIIFCGDGRQDDLFKDKNDVSGFRDFLAVAMKMPEFRCFRFTSDDIVRSPFVKSWIMTCERLGIM